jgi:hypothetical protein
MPQLGDPHRGIIRPSRRPSPAPSVTPTTTLSREEAEALDEAVGAKATIGARSLRRRCAASRKISQGGKEERRAIAPPVKLLHS